MSDTGHTALVRVKPLEWEERRTPLGLVWWSAPNPLGALPFEARTENEKAVHQANLERRILYAIEPSPSLPILVEALEGLLDTVSRLDICEGVCCCGDDMERHSDPMSCGHVPVDAGEYYHGKTIELARAALASIKGDRLVPAHVTIEEISE
jgi:hypothetical protein